MEATRYDFIFLEWTNCFNAYPNIVYIQCYINAKIDAKFRWFSSRDESNEFTHTCTLFHVTYILYRLFKFVLVYVCMNIESKYSWRSPAFSFIFLLSVITMKTILSLFCFCFCDQIIHCHKYQFIFENITYVYIIYSIMFRYIYIWVKILRWSDHFLLDLKKKKLVFIIFFSFFGFFITAKVRDIFSPECYIRAIVSCMTENYKWLKKKIFFVNNL